MILLLYFKNIILKHMKKLLIVFVSLTMLFSFNSDYRPEAPMFTLKNTLGHKVSLSDFKGKVVYIDVWATWCKACIEQMPYGKKLVESYAHNDSIVFINISIDDDKLAWQNFVRKKALKGINLNSEGGTEEKIVERYGISFIPHYIMIDKEGRVFKNGATHPSDSETKRQLDELLKE